MVSSSSCLDTATAFRPSRAARRRARLRRTAVLSSTQNTAGLLQSFQCKGFEGQTDYHEICFPRADAPEFIPLIPLVDHLHELLVAAPVEQTPVRRALQDTWTAEALPFKPVPSNVVIILQPLTMPSVAAQTLDLFGSALQVAGRRKLSDTQVPTTLNTPKTPDQALQLQPCEVLEVPESLEAASINIGGGVMASSPILHRYIQIACLNGTRRGHVFDMIPELTPLPEHVCVRFVSMEADFTFQWFRHDRGRSLLCDAHGEYTYSLDGPLVRTSVSLAHILSRSLGKDQHRHHTKQILQQVMCPGTPENFDHCLREMCAVQRTTSISMLAYGMLRSAKCESSPQWLEYLACACDFVVAVRRTGGHGDLALASSAAVKEDVVTVEPLTFNQSEFVRICRGDLCGQKGYIAGRTKEGRWGIALLSGGCGFACADDLERAKRPRRTEDSVIHSMIETARSGCTAFL